MTAVDTHRYPELRQLFGAYLNADFAGAYDSVAQALAAYRRETGSGHRAAARAELDRLTAEPGAAIRLADDLIALGCEVQLAGPGQAWQLAASVRRALEPEMPEPD